MPASFNPGGGSSFDPTAPGPIGSKTAAAGTFTTILAGSAASVLLGTAGSAVGSAGFRNATSGTATIAPPTGALGAYTVTLPNASSTLPIFGQQMTFIGPTAARTVTLPDAAFTVARTDAAQTFVGLQTFPSLTTTGAVTMTAGTASTTTGTGTLVITGGLGVSGIINAGPGITLSGGASGVETTFKATNDASKVGVFGVRGSASGGYGTLPNNGAELYASNALGIYVDNSGTGDIGAGTGGSVVCRHQFAGSSGTSLAGRAGHVLTANGFEQVLTIQQFGTTANQNATIAFKGPVFEKGAVGWAFNSGTAFGTAVFVEAWDGGETNGLPAFKVLQTTTSTSYRRFEIAASGNTPGDIIFYNASAGFPSETVHTTFATSGLTTHNGPVKPLVTTVSGLPSAATAGAGAAAFVTDGSATLILGLGVAVTGGGSNKVPVYSDGTSWIVG